MTATASASSTKWASARYVVAFAVAAAVAGEIGKHEIPLGPENIHYTAQVVQVVAQFGQRDQVELVEYLGDVIDRGIQPGLLAEIADVPGRDIDRLVQHRRRDLRFGYSFP